MATAYLEQHPPRQTQFRPRRAKPTGLIVVHTAESAPDVQGPDDGTLNVARFIENRSDYGSYHWLADSDSKLLLIPMRMAAYGDGTGSNEFAIHISAATQAARWASLPKAWRDGCVKQMAQAAARSALWLKRQYGIIVPARRVTLAESNAGKAGFISHGERDPGRRTDPGADFPWDQFLREFAAAFKALVQPVPPPPAPEPEFAVTQIGMAHVSMQFSDSDKQMAEDVERIFQRAANRDLGWITGTEAGGVKAQPLPELLAAAAAKHGYRFHTAYGEWVVVREDLIKGNWEQGFVDVLEAHASRTGSRHTRRGIATVAFDTKRYGRINIGVSHYLTKGRKPGDPNYDLNTQLTEAIGAWATEVGKGKALVFYHGDQNIVDRVDDTFRGQPLTSAWDELEKHENTGHGNIDVIASYDRDARVEATRIRALDDREFHLHTDHFFVEAEYDVEHVKS